MLFCRWNPFISPLRPALTAVQCFRIIIVVLRIVIVDVSVIFIYYKNIFSIVWLCTCVVSLMSFHFLSRFVLPAPWSDVEKINWIFVNWFLLHSKDEEITQFVQFWTGKNIKEFDLDALSTSKKEKSKVNMWQFRCEQSWKSFTSYMWIAHILQTTLKRWKAIQSVKLPETVIRCRFNRRSLFVAGAT